MDTPTALRSQFIYHFFMEKFGLLYRMWSW